MLSRRKSDTHFGFLLEFEPARLKSGLPGAMLRLAGAISHVATLLVFADTSSCES